MNFKKTLFFLLSVAILSCNCSFLSAQTDDKKTTETKKTVKTTRVKKVVKDNPDAIYYTVGSSETLYAIARKNEVTVDDIKKWNNLTDKSFIHKGDRLIVGLISLKKAKPEDVVTIKSPEKIDTKKPKKDDDEDYIDEKYKKQNNNSKDKTETKEISEKTVASWIDDGTLVSAKSLALHTTAPEGTIMKVTNMMNKKSVYVKIVGNIPAGEENNVTIKMTRTAAEKLGAIDKFFRVELHYAAEVIKDKKK